MIAILVVVESDVARMRRGIPAREDDDTAVLRLALEIQAEVLVAASAEVARAAVAREPEGNCSRRRGELRY